MKIPEKMKIADFRKLIGTGQEIEWDTTSALWPIRSGTVLQAVGLNIEVDECGSHNWYWLPTLNRHGLRLKGSGTEDPACRNANRFCR